MSRRFGSLDHNSSLTHSGRRPVRRIQDHSDTQRSLQEASVALENAFDRIRNVRRNLLRLAETLPEPLTTGSSNSDQDSVDPGHEALVLSGGTMEEPGREISNPGTVAPDIRVGGATNTPPRSPSPIRSHSTMAVDPPTLGRAPPLPSVLPPRFSRQNMYGLSPNSAATTHGLRVAARETANSTANNDRAFVATPRDPRSDALEFERLLAQGPIEYGAALDTPDAFRFQSAIRGRPNHVSAIAPPVFPASVPPNVYQYRFDPLMGTPDPSNRLNYLPLPPAPPPGRRPIPRPSSHFPGPPLPRPTTANVVGSSDESNNENLTEYQFVSWLFPAQDYASSLVPRRDPHNPDTIRVTRENEPTSSHPELEPRRRGWARLDADGNEISWDEEEELERSRTEYRLRVRDGSNGPEIRHDGRTFHGSVLDSMLSIPLTRPRTDQWRSATTTDIQGRLFWVDPLPMPLSSMITKEENQDDCYPDVIVPRHACFAGR